jgi:hypothetical protein
LSSSIFVGTVVGTLVRSENGTNKMSANYGKLTDVTARQAKPKATTYRKSDGQGLNLEIRPSGAKYWRLSYRFNGKQKTLALGVYPDVGLAEARENCCT